MLIPTLDFTSLKRWWGGRRLHHSIQRIGTSFGNGFALFPTLMLMCGKVSQESFVELTDATLFRHAGCGRKNYKALI